MNTSLQAAHLSLIKGSKHPKLVNTCIYTGDHLPRRGYKKNISYIKKVKLIEGLADWRMRLTFLEEGVSMLTVMVNDG